MDYALEARHISGMFRLIPIALALVLSSCSEPTVDEARLIEMVENVMCAPTHEERATALGGLAEILRNESISEDHLWQMASDVDCPEMGDNVTG